MGDQDKNLTRRGFFQKSSRTLLAFGTGALLASTTTVWASSGCFKTSSDCDLLNQCACNDPQNSSCTKTTCDPVV